MPSLSILFFSRGRGHGHALPDLAIAAALRVKFPQLRLRFASYATGRLTLQEGGEDVIPLPLNEDNGFVEALLPCEELIRTERPDLVICHEEFAAVTGARIAGVPSIFLSAWLPPSGTVLADSLRSAGAVVVLGNPGVFREPVELRVRPHYTGPFIRRLDYTCRDRAKARAELEMDPAAATILAVTGGWATEQRVPILDILLSAFIMLENENKRLLILSSSDYDETRKRTKDVGNITVLNFYSPIERLLAACDVVITKGTRGITLDAAAAGIPSISLSGRTNPIDDLLVPRMASNIALFADAVDGTSLHQYITHCLASGPNEPLPAASTGPDAACEAIGQSLRLLRPDGF